MLVAVKDALDATDDLIRGTDLDAVHAALGDAAKDEKATVAALDVLADADYIDATIGYGNPPKALRIKLLEKGRQEVSGWPASPGGDYGAKLLDELERRIAEADDEEERTRLQRFRDAVADVGKGVVTGVLTDMARGL